MRTEYWIILIEIGIVLFILCLIGFLRFDGEKKLLTILGLPVLLIFGLPYTGLWKFSLNKYVKEEKSNLLILVNKIDQLNKDELTYISCFEDGRLNTRPKLDKKTMVNAREHICPEFLKVDCVAVAIHKDKNYYLFIIQSFIGNGDGLLYCKDDVHWEEIIDVRINGYEVTGVTQVEHNWFYVIFT